jgi:hypothetical protein
MKVAEAAMPMMLGRGGPGRHGERAGDKNCDCENFDELRHR